MDAEVEIKPEMSEEILSKDEIWDDYCELPRSLEDTGSRVRCKMCDEEMGGIPQHMKLHKQTCTTDAATHEKPPKENKYTRPRHIIWNEYDVLPKCADKIGTRVECKACGKEMLGQAQRMRIHKEVSCYPRRTLSHPVLSTPAVYVKAEGVVKRENRLVVGKAGPSPMAGDIFEARLYDSCLQIVKSECDVVEVVVKKEEGEEKTSLEEEEDDKREKVFHDPFSDEEECMKPFKCDECPFRHASNIGLVNHRRTHGPKRAFVCSKCPYTANSQTGLGNHLRTHAPRQKYKCAKCPFRSHTQTGLSNHARTHAHEQIYACTQCFASFKHHKSLTKHTRDVHVQFKSYPCKVCPFRATSVYHYEVHSRKHTGEKPYQCDICSYKTNWRNAYRTHLKVHTGEKPFKCAECAYSAPVKASLELHIRTHTGEKPYVCSQCPYKSTTNSHMKRHVLRTHSKEKPFKCTECDFGTGEKSVLVIHTRKHTGEKPFKCNLCTYSAAEKSKLTVHYRQHTGIKPYSCHVCCFRFAVRSRLKRHLQTQHPAPAEEKEEAVKQEGEG